MVTLLRAKGGVGAAPEVGVIGSSIVGRRAVRSG